MVAMTGLKVNVDNFARAETDRMFHDFVQLAGGVNRLFHIRSPTPLDAQTVVRMNRDTLYSAAIVDVTSAASVTVPDTGDRYISVSVVNEDHYINEIFHEPGTYPLSIDQFDTPFVSVNTRILVDPNDPDDVAKVNALQDQLAISATSALAFEMPNYDTATLDATRSGLLALSAGLDGYDRAFGRKSDLDPVRHLIGVASGWGGLPETEAYYANVDPGLPIGRYQLTVGSVPVDAFWSISVYNSEGYFEPSDSGAPSVNGITAQPNDDGSITVTFGGGPDDPNNLYIMEGWNYIVRLYRPRPEALDGTWTFPSATKTAR
jgi:hypothetical protein